jgi:hypothetical protein
LQNINVAVAGVGAGFKVEAEQLKREGAALRGIPAVKRRGIDRQRADGFIFFQRPGAGDPASALE